MTLMVSVSGVRGIVGPEFHPQAVGAWATAFSEIQPAGPIVLGRDSRPTGGALAQSASAYLQSLGREVLDVGVVPTPTVQLAVESWGAAGGLILSASHNPIEWNALKFVDHDGSFLSPDRFALLRQAHEAGSATICRASDYGRSTDRGPEALELHLRAVLGILEVDRIRAAGLTVALETGHGAGGTLLPRLAEALGITVDGHHLEPTGALLRHPEPTVDSLREVLGAVSGAVDFAVMIDPDADRCGLALPGGEILGEEWTLPLVVRHRLEQAQGPLVTNLSTSTRLEAAARSHGVAVIRTPVGEAHVVAEMKASGALIGGEGNGGVIDPRVHLGRDSAVALALLAEAHASHPQGLAGLAEAFPPRFMLKDKVEIPENRLEGVWESLEGLFGPAGDRRDGYWWSREDGFLHVRASNTEPIVRIVVESSSLGGSAGQLEKIASVLRQV